MGIFDFFKKKKQKTEGIKKISFKEIEEEINNKKQKNEENQKEPKNQIKKSLSELLHELEQGKNLIENLDLEKKKAPERAKLIVRENLIKFNHYLEGLILNLKNLNSEPLETLINKINLIFCEFEKKSLKSFQKSTFLIGEELGGIEENIRKFYRKFNRIIKENEQIIEESKKILIIEEKLKEFNEINKSILDNNEEIKEIEKKIKTSEEKSQALKKEIEDKKMGTEYINRINTLQEIEKLKNDLVIKLRELKDSIDFKALTNVYHSIGSQMELIKGYKENFKETLEKRGFEILQELVNIQGINQDLINEKIKEIREIEQDISEIQIEEDMTDRLTKSLLEIKRGIDNFNFDKTGKQRRDKNLIEEKNKTEKEITEEAINLNIIVKD